jgi:hypothetical protein
VKKFIGVKFKYRRIIRYVKSQKSQVIISTFF